MSEHETTAPRPRRKLLGALVALGVLVLACVAFWLIYTNWSGPTSEPRTADDPIIVTEGDSFTFSGFTYEAGWEIRGIYDELTISDLVAANIGEDITYPSIAITLEQDSVEVASITCSGSGLKPGESTFLQCSSDDEVPAEFDQLVVSDAHSS